MSAECSTSEDPVKSYEVPTPRHINKRRSTVPDLTPRGNDTSCEDSMGFGTGFLASTGYLIRLADNNKLLPQDKGVLLGDRGSLPVLPKALAAPKSTERVTKPRWPADVPAMCVGAHVRISQNKLGVVDKWLPGKSKWAVTLTNGDKKAYTEDSLQAISTSVARRQKVTLIDVIDISADPDDPDDHDVSLPCGTRGIITSVDEEDGGAFMEFECLPGAELPIEREWFHKLKFYQDDLGLWTYFYEPSPASEEAVALPTLIEYASYVAAASSSELEAAVIDLRLEAISRVARICRETIIEDPSYQAAQLQLHRTIMAERQDMPLCFRGSYPSERNGEMRGRVRLLAYGDSLTAGFYSRGYRFAPYGKFLASELVEHFDIDVYVNGLSGLTASILVEKQYECIITDVIQRNGMGLQYLLQNLEPFDAVLLMVGTNDLKHDLHCPEVIVENIKKLHEICHSVGTPTVALSVPDNMLASEAPGAEDCDEFTKHYAAAWRTVNDLLRCWAAANSTIANAGVSFVDTSEVVPFTRYGGLFDDPIHFSVAGSEKLGRFLADTVRHLVDGIAKLKQDECQDVLAEAADCEEMRIGVEQMSIETQCAVNVPAADDVLEGSQSRDDVVESLWAIEHTAVLCGLGEEAIFEGKSQLLDKRDITSVSIALVYLNSSEGSAAFPDGHCVVFSSVKQKYFLLYRLDKQAFALDLFNLKLETS